MRQLELTDIIPNAEYERQREQRRKEAMELRARRRAQLGDKVALVFENRRTLTYQVQEMMRVEQISALDGVLQELEVYNGLVPAEGELSATLFIQLASDADLRRWLPVFARIEGRLFLQIGDERVAAQFEPGRSEEGRTAAVHYVKFSLTPGQAQALKAAPARFVVDLPEYSVSADVADSLRAELLADLAAD